MMLCHWVNTYVLRNSDYFIYMAMQSKKNAQPLTQWPNEELSLQQYHCEKLNLIMNYFHTHMLNDVMMVHQPKHVHLI